MKILCLILVLAATSALAVPYRPNVQRSEYSYSSSSPSGANFSPWAQSHMDDVNQMAERMRQQYNVLSRGGGSSSSYSSSYTSGSNLHYPSFAGKSQEELDVLAKQITEDIIRDMRTGKIEYNQISQPLWFEQQAALKLESLSEQDDLQQQSQSVFDSPSFSSFPGYGRDVETIQVNEGTSHVAYPPSVSVINGRQYITKKNCTTSTSSGGTIPTVWPSRPVGSESIFTYNKTESHNTGPLYISGGKSKGIYQYVNESQVSNYNPQVIIPVDKREFETFDSNFGKIDTGSHVVYPSGGKTVTIEEYNISRIGYPGHEGVVTGSERKKVVVDGKVVYDSYNPFGNFSLTKDDEWRKREREYLFWLFQQPSFTMEDLKTWQREQEDRLHTLAYRYNTTIENIEEWQRRELLRYQELMNQYDAFNRDLTDWQRNERARIDWLIHQNAITREELEKWQQKNRNQLYALARQYRISLDELENWQRKELDRLYLIFNKQNSEIDNLKIWQEQERDKLRTIILNHNTTVDELQESIRRDQDRLRELARTYHFNVEEMEKWLKTELQRLTGVIEQQKEEMKRISNWQINERTRLENILRNHNFTVEELEEKLKRDRNYLYDLARQYKVSIEEIQEWQKEELKRLQKDGLIQIEQELKEWQQRERDRLQLILRNHNYTITELEKKLKFDQDRLAALANKYHVSVEEIKEWQQKELNRLQSEGLLHIENQLKLWQQQERDRLLAVIRNHNLTIAELERGLKQDQNRLYTLAQQYHTSVEELKRWQEQEIKRLQTEGLREVEVQLKEWQQKELNRILGILRHHNLTIEELERQLKEDKHRLFEVANQYHISVDEIKEWQRQEIKRLQDLGFLQIKNQLKEWQQTERNRLLDIIQRHNLTINDLEIQLKTDQSRLLNIARQYQISVEEIKDWQMKEIQRLKDLGMIQIEKQLQKWQQEERERLLGIIRQHNLTIADLERRLQHDQRYLDSLAHQYHISIEEIQKWQKEEIKRLQEQNLLEIQNQLKNWQRHEFDIILNMIRRHNVTIEELERRLKEDETRLHAIAQQYHISVEEIKAWQQQELKRLQELGVVGIREQIKVWQENEKARLMQLIRENNLSIEELKRQLQEDRAHLARLAQQYHITVEQIEEWIISEVNRPVKGIISADLKDWELKEQDYINSLLQQHDWTRTELEIKLKQDRDRLYRLAQEYHTTVQEIEDFYKRELERLLYEGSIHELNMHNLANWQKQELEKLYLIIQQHQLTIQELEDRLQSDRALLERLAQQYRIAVEELESWLRNEYQRLLKIGLIKSNLPSIDFSDWSDLERKRLETIAKEIKITLEEFEEFLRDDHEYQEILCKKYQITMPELLNFQKYELQRMLREGKLQHLALKHLEPWQKLERDHIFRLIRNGIMDYDRFINWQREHQGLLQKLAAQYRISLQTLENFQRSEMERLLEIADYYKMTINEIEDFRAKELDRLSMYAHYYTTTTDLFEAWIRQEAARLQHLRSRYNLALVELIDWRRRLFLLCQGLIDLDKQPIVIPPEVSPSKTNVTMKRNDTIISKDRGDQPPQPYDDEYEDEPSVWNNREPTTPRSTPSWQPTPPYLAPLAPLPSPQLSTPVQRESGGYYHKKEVTVTGPVITGVNVDAQQSGSLSSSRTTAFPAGSHGHEVHRSGSRYESHQTVVSPGNIPVTSSGGYDINSASRTRSEPVSRNQHDAVPSYYDSQQNVRGSSSPSGSNSQTFSGSSRSGSSHSGSFHPGSSYSGGSSYAGSYAGNRGAHASVSGTYLPPHQGSTQVQYTSGGGSQGQSSYAHGYQTSEQKETDYEEEEEDVQKTDNQFRLEAFELNDQQHVEDLTQQTEDFGQQVIDFGQKPEDFKEQADQQRQKALKYQHENLNHQQQQQRGVDNDKIMSQYTNQEPIGSADYTAKVEEIQPGQVEEVQTQPAEQDKSLWTKIKDKAKNVFG